MSARTPSAPPLLDGYEYLELLGSGGFADVFKYQQLRPRREVAIKVLLRGMGAEAQRQFEAEANLMAMLSNHPSIVSIFSAGVAPDGRPYLVMENCQPRHLGVRLRQRPLSVGRALEIGIQVAGAVETAHRLGIFHRDIKPANILFTDYGRPALTDFGISIAEGGQGAAAFSVAWAPPEQIENRGFGPSGDVYSLAATVWAMLVGRSPFDVPGDNNSLAISARVKSTPVPPTGRAGVPESLERVLRTAMSKDAASRYASALEFARALQGVQAELHESVTTIDVREDRPDDDLVDLTETGTRVTGFAVIDPELAPERTDSGWFEVSDSRGTRLTNHTGTAGDTDGLFGGVPGGVPGVPGGGQRDAPTATGAGVLQHGRGSRQAHEPLEFTGPAVPRVPDEDTYVAGSGVPLLGEPVASPRPRRRLLPLALAGSAIVVVGGLAAGFVLSGQGNATTGRAPAPTAAKPKDPLGAVPQPTDVKGVAQSSTVVFTWTNPDPKQGDRYDYRPVLVDREVAVSTSETAAATVDKQAGPTCLEVALVRASGQASGFVKACTP